ncbi:MAG: hypothetical protein CL916_14525 [Deltaproteobacteria bacterium]|nr:hypothetical protein [Deltaproteobacteria bacterium]
MGYDETTREALDWSMLTMAIDRFCGTSTGRRLLQRDFFAQNVIQARYFYSELEELKQCIQEDALPPFRGMPDVHGVLNKAQRKEALDIPEILLIVQLVNLIKEAKNWVENQGTIYPKIYARLSGIPLSSQFYFTLTGSFDAEGALSRDMYPTLYRMMEQYQKLKQQVQSTLQEMLVTYAPMMQENFYTKRNGRYVLPMKANYKRTAGIVHGRSQSSETFYVEPIAMVELSNRCMEVESAIEQETRRIVLQLSSLISAHVEELFHAEQSFGELDVVHAKLQLGTRWNGVVPKIKEEGMIAVVGLRHPILEIQIENVVPNDILLSGQHPALVISGPNAGGKTISLKAVGLIAWMARCGIPIPAKEGARVDFFSHIYADIGDDQKLEEGLSTFSGQLLKLKNLLERNEEQSLILLDELGMGTDPAQGSALAQATMERLLDSHARVVVTTHFSRIKALSAVDSRFVNVAAEFRGGRPTYRLYRGEVGESHALALARDVGLCDSLIARSQELLSGKERELGELLLELDRVRVQVEQREHELIRSRRIHEEEKQRLEKIMLDQERRKNEIENQVREEIRVQFFEKERYVQELIKTLVQNPSLKLASDSLAELRNIQRDMEPKEESSSQPLVQPEELQVGDMVIHQTMGAGFTIDAMSRKNRITLSRGGLILEAKKTEVYKDQSPKKRSSKKNRPKKKQRKNRKKEAVCVRGDWNTLDLRGTRLDESKDRCRVFFDRHIRQGDGVVFVLHGHGTGALKKGLRSWFPKQSIISSWRPGNAQEGGDAFSVVFLDIS